MPLDLTASARPHGAQRMFSLTILVVEAFLVFFAALAAHQLVPDGRVVTWTWSLLTIAALLVCSRLLKQKAWPYVLGAVLQLPVVLLGLQLPLMWILGLAFGGLYVYGVVAGHRLDAEKDAVDARVLAARAAEDGPTGA